MVDHKQKIQLSYTNLVGVSTVLFTIGWMIVDLFVPATEKVHITGAFAAAFLTASLYVWFSRRKAVQTGPPGERPVVTAIAVVVWAVVSLHEYQSAANTTNTLQLGLIGIVVSFGPETFRAIWRKLRGVK